MLRGIGKIAPKRNKSTYGLQIRIHHDLLWCVLLARSSLHLTGVHGRRNLGERYIEDQQHDGVNSPDRIPLDLERVAVLAPEQDHPQGHQAAKHPDQQERRSENSRLRHLLYREQL